MRKLGKLLMAAGMTSFLVMGSALDSPSLLPVAAGMAISAAIAYLGWKLMERKAAGFEEWEADRGDRAS